MTVKNSLSPPPSPPPLPALAAHTAFPAFAPFPTSGRERFPFSQCVWSVPLVREGFEPCSEWQGEKGVLCHPGKHTIICKAVLGAQHATPVTQCEMGM